MNMPFGELHELYRIAYLKMEARIEEEEKEKEEKEKEKKKDEQFKKQTQLGNVRAPKLRAAMNRQPIDASESSIPPSIDMDEFEEILEDGGVI